MPKTKEYIKNLQPLELLEGPVAKVGPFFLFHLPNAPQ